MLNKSISILIFLFFQLLLINPSSAGEVKYYSPEGNLITKEKYKELSKKVQKKVQEIKMAKIQSLLKETDENGRSKFDYRDGELVHLIYEKPNTKPQYTKNVASKTPHDKYSRRYTYPIINKKVKIGPNNYTYSYNDEKLKDERLLRKLQIQNELNKMNSSSFEYLRKMREDFSDINRALYDRSFNYEDFTTRMQLDNIERNTREIKRKLYYGW